MFDKCIMLRPMYVHLLFHLENTEAKMFFLLGNFCKPNKLFTLILSDCVQQPNM